MSIATQGKLLPLLKGEGLLL